MPSTRHESERQIVAVRLDPAAIAEVDRLAARDAEALSDSINRSEEVRRMLAFAAAKMPPGWQPSPKSKVSFL